MPIARYLNEANVQEGVFFPGVPLADITEEEFDALPKHLQEAVDASPMYRKTKPAEKKAANKAAPKEAEIAPEVPVEDVTKAPMGDYRDEKE